MATYEHTLIKDNIIQATIKIDSVTEDCITFRVFEAEAWDALDIPIKFEFYCKGEIRFDGCSNITFKEPLHLCGDFFWNLHNDIMSFIWKIANSYLNII